jgi:hypothetical protein
MTAGRLPGPFPDRGGQAIRLDSELAGLDVAAAISRGIGAAGQSRHVMFTEAAIAAAIQAEALGVGPYPVGFLARFVRTGGVAAALRLPEPLVGAESCALARGWMEAALAAGSSVDADLVFARWLEMVATLMAARRSVRPGPGSLPADPSDPGTAGVVTGGEIAAQAATDSTAAAADNGAATAGTGQIAAALRGTVPGAHAAGRGAHAAVPGAHAARGAHAAVPGA